LAVSAIAAQFEHQGSLQITPFFTAAGGDVHTNSFTAVLPQVQWSAADRPTISFTPLDDQDFTRRLFTTLPLEGIVYLVKTTWPISTVFRLYLENLNWVSNAQTASGPAPRQPPEFADFLRGIDALQTLQDRGQVVFTQEENREAANLAADRVTATAMIEAAKNGQEYQASTRRPKAGRSSENSSSLSSTSTRPCSPRLRWRRLPRPFTSRLA
jgi:hypothetical protein